jgi:oligosaccharide repeat unit polymerase
MEQRLDTDYLEQDVPTATPAFGEPSPWVRTLYLAWLLVAILISGAIYALGSGGDYELSTRVAVVFGIIVFWFHLIYRMFQKPVNWLAPDLMFLLAFFLFHFGYLGLWLFGLVPYADKPMYYINLYPKTMFIVNLGMISFLFGYEILTPKIADVGVRKIPGPLWTSIGLSLMLIAMAIHIAYIFAAGIGNWLAEGYTVTAHMERYVAYPRLWQWQTLFFSLGLGTYLVSVALRYGCLFHGKLGITLFVIFFALLFFEGDRTEMVKVGFVLLLVRHYLIKPFKLKWLAICFVLALAAFAALRIVRHTAAFDPAKMKEELEYAREAEMLEWYSPFVEMGGSVGTVNLTTHLVPDDQPYWHGRTYVQAIIHIVPYLSGSRVGQYFGAGPGQWLTWTLKGPQAAGTGFSVAAEGYLNFGIPGVFFHMAFLGFLFRRIYAAFSKSVSPARALVFIVIFGIMIIQVRNHTGVVSAPFAQIIVVAWLLKHICGEYNVATDDGQAGLCLE